MVFYQKYGKYNLVACYNGDYWTGYMNFPSDEVGEVIERKIHGGIKCSKNFNLGVESYGFQTNEKGDINIGPDEEEKPGVWGKKTLFSHMKSVIDLAEKKS